MSVYKHSSNVLSCWRPPLFFAQQWSIKKHSPDSGSLLQSSVQVRVTQDGPGAPESVVTGTGSWDALCPQRHHYHTSCSIRDNSSICTEHLLHLQWEANVFLGTVLLLLRSEEKDRGRERDRVKHTERNRNREIQWETHTEKETESGRECVCVFLTQSSLPGSSVCVTPWTVACQAPLSMGFPRQENWNGWPFPPLGDLLNPGIEVTSPEFPSIGRGIL